MNRIEVRQWIPWLRRHSLSALAWVTLPCLAVSAQAQAPDPRPMLTACSNHTPPFVFMRASTNWPPLEPLHAFLPSWTDRPCLHRLISRAHATGSELTRQLDEANLALERGGSIEKLRRRHLELP